MYLCTKFFKNPGFENLAPPKLSLSPVEINSTNEMKRILLPAIAFLSMHTLLAQPIPVKSIEDSVLGWMKVYHFKGAKAAIKVDDKSYSVGQLSICDSLVNWMQASYLPKGGLGDVKRVVSEKQGLYNKNDAAMPQSYGANAAIYSQLKYNAQGKLALLTSDAIFWIIKANSSVGIPTDAICTPTKYYFTLPAFKEFRNSENNAQVLAITSHPNTKRYPAYLKRNTSGMFDFGFMIYPENKFPFVKITKAEYLDQLAAAIERKYVLEKEDAINKWYTADTRATARKYADDRYQKRVAVLKDNRDKYKNDLNTVAEIFTDQPDILLENYPDVFEGNGAGSKKLPVYKIDPMIAENCKKDTPQWFMVTWNGGLNTTVGNTLHESILNNFNFEYLHNFFFYPDKVKGQTYRPVRSASYEEVVVAGSASKTQMKLAADKSVFLFEDFSTNAVGKKPMGWKSGLAPNGTTALVTNRDGLDGNWLQLRGHSISATAVKKPFPQNFTLTYDVVVPQNFTWGAKGLTMELSKETSPGNAESFILLKLRPGANGANGEAMVETKFTSPPGYLTGSKWYAVEGFSNGKKNNRISVTLKKAEEKIEVYIGTNKIAAYPKALPAALLFNALSFDSGGNTAENDTYYISNIKIVKD